MEDALDLITSTNQLAKKVLDAQTVVIYPNTVEKQREYQEQVVRVFYLASGDAKGAANFLKSMLKVRDPFIDERTNMIALRESQETIQLAERLIAVYDTPDAEVMLEVEVIEVNATRLTELGIKFPEAASLTLLPPVGSSALNLGNIRGVTRDRVEVGIGGVLLNFKREVGDFNTLANPRIRARNKEKARILVGDKIPIVTATTGTGGFVSDSVTYLDVGLKVEVEPTIYTDDDVGIKLALEVSSLGVAQKTSSGTLAYQIGTRNASTSIRLHDGETQLLGGLISRDERTASSRLPGIGDLPVLGRLFSSQNDTSQRTELVLAITPRIVRNIRRPDITETELWIGTEAAPRLRPIGGLRTASAAPEVKTAEQAVASSNPVPVPGTQSAAESDALARPAWKLGGPQEVKVGDTFEVEVGLSSRTLLRGAPIELTFSAANVALVDATEADFFKRDGTPTSFSKGGSDAVTGRIGLAVMRNTATGISGQGAVYKVRMKALAAGDATVSLTSAQAIGIGAPALPALPTPPLAIVIR